MGISGTKAASSSPKGPPGSAQNHMIHKGQDHHCTSCRCNERKREGSGDHRRESGHNGDHYEGSEPRHLNLGESMGAVKGRDVAGIAPQQPTNDSLHRQISDLQVHLQKVEAEKARLIKQGNHQEMDWFTVYSASVGREARNTTEDADSPGKITSGSSRALSNEAATRGQTWPPAGAASRKSAT